MEAYIDYKFYTGTFKGKAIPESAFDRVAIEASFYVNRCCFGRITDDILNDNEVGEKVKHATCATAEIIRESNEKGGISSESTGNASTTYVRDTVRDRKKISTVSMYLSDTGLMYRGVK